MIINKILRAVIVCFLCFFSYYSTCKYDFVKKDNMSLNKFGSKTMKDVEIKKKIFNLLQNMKMFADFVEIHPDEKKYYGNLLCDLEKKKIRISYSNDEKIIILDRNRVNILHDGELNIVRSKDTPMTLLLNADSVNIDNIKELKKGLFKCDLENDKYFLQLLYDVRKQRITMIYSPSEDCIIKFFNFASLDSSWQSGDLFFVSPNKFSSTRKYKNRESIMKILMKRR